MTAQRRVSQSPGSLLLWHLLLVIHCSHRYLSSFGPLYSYQWLCGTTGQG